MPLGLGETVMNERERTKALLKSSSERIKSHAAGLLKDPAIKAAVQQEQNPVRKKSPSEKAPSAKLSKRA
jgi:hypothetical protein